VRLRVLNTSLNTNKVLIYGEKKGREGRGSEGAEGGKEKKRERQQRGERLD